MEVGPAIVVTYLKLDRMSTVIDVKRSVNWTSSSDAYAFL